MSAWDQFSQSQKTRQQTKRRIAVLAGVGLLVAAVAAVILIPLLLNQPEAADLAEIRADAPAQTLTQTDQNRAAAAPANPRPQPSGGVVVVPEAAPADIEAERLASLANNLQAREIDQFQKTAGAGQTGPRQLQFDVSGSGRTHSFVPGQATFGETDVVGAAGEWFVRPWWKPGWVPNSADCGEIGTTAIAGHVSWAGRPGPFHEIGAMTAGDQIRCQATSGRWFTYTVEEVVRIDYTNTDYYWRSLEENRAELTLFSCTPEITGIVVVRAAIQPENG